MLQSRVRFDFQKNKGVFSRSETKSSPSQHICHHKCSTYDKLCHTPQFQDLTTMLAIRELLNPVKSEEKYHDNLDGGVRQRVVYAKNSASSRRRYCPQEFNGSRQQSKVNPIHRVVLSSPSPQGPVNFPPFEDVDEETKQRIMKFNIREFGSITSSCEHIPYNSSKKDFFAKTGRESIEGLKALVSKTTVTNERN